MKQTLDGEYLFTFSEIATRSIQNKILHNMIGGKLWKQIEVELVNEFVQLFNKFFGVKIRVHTLLDVIRLADFIHVAPLLSAHAADRLYGIWDALGCETSKSQFVYLAEFDKHEFLRRTSANTQKIGVFDRKYANYLMKFTGSNVANTVWEVLETRLYFTNQHFDLDGNLREE
jgi:hypothetical protein